MPRLGRPLFALLLGAALAAPAAGALAQDASPVPSPDATVPNGCTVVADGLTNPRYLAIADDGTLYVTEAGNGGDEVVGGAPAADASPSAEATASAEEGSGGEDQGSPPEQTRGGSGRVVAIAPDGTQTVIADGLPSYQEGVGPTGIVLANGLVWVSIGGGSALLGADPLPNENSVVSIDPATGTVTLVANLGQYELDNNPDGTDVNPNLYGMTLGGDGQLYVNDAGGNTVYKVDPATGSFTLLGIVPSPQMAPPSGDASPIADEETSGGIQPVPTGIFAGADGNLYVVTLGALVPGAAELFIAQADGTFTSVATGLTTGVGIALGPDGALYVSELASLTDPNLPPGPGRVVRIEADGTVTPVIEGIPAPHGIAFDAAGNLYVIANSTVFGPPPAAPAGQVLRCEGFTGANG